MCPHCSSRALKKDGKYKEKQLWRCKNCYKQCARKQKSYATDIWHRYTHGKQTYKQLALHYGKSVKWVQRQLQKIEVQQGKHLAGDTVIVMDTTYFGRVFGVMVWRCVRRKKNLLWMFLKQENIHEYTNGIAKLRADDWNIQAIVCDGKPGLLKSFSCPVQMCQFHQAAIITRYVTRRPKLQAGIELQELMRVLPKTDEASFRHWLDLWHERWKDFLAEKTTDVLTGKWHYTHRRLRSAYRSLQTNLPYLFTYQKYPHLRIPNTTNSLEGIFAHIKDKVRLHRGLKLKRKQKLIEELLRGK